MTTTTESASDYAELDSRSNISHESSFYGSKATQWKYERAVEEYDDSDYWRVHDWNVQVIAARAVKRQIGHTRRNVVKQRTGQSLQSVSEVVDRSGQSPRSTRKRKRSDAESAKDDSSRELKMADSKDDVKAEELKMADLKDDSKSMDNPKASNEVEAEPKRLYNPYEGNNDAMQLNETPDEFLARLKPSTTEIPKPWIWVANFHSKVRALTGDVASFRQLATKALEVYSSKKTDLERGDSKLAESAITRKLRPDRVALEAKINEAAKKYGVVHGKWMLFPHVTKVDGVWETVVRATASGQLGCTAKVATRMGGSEEDGRLICVYTDDCFDRDDVKRVLKEMHALGLVDLTSGEGGRRGIYYKCDAYTHLDIRSGNEYKLKASMYSSKDLWDEMKKNKEL